MVMKAVKYVVVPAVALVAVGGLIFGDDLFSYVSSSARSLRTSVKDSVPIDFELQRARDLLEEIVPEMHANIRLIAQEEVEVENLKKDIARCDVALADGKAKIHKLGQMLGTERVYFTISDRQYSRESIKGDLARRFERYKEAEVVLQGKRRLLATRQKSLDAAVQMLDKARSRKALLADRIESLASQHRLVKAASVGSRFQIESSKIAQTDKLIREIKKRLDVAERVLAHEGKFLEPIPVDIVEEKDLLTQVREHFGTGTDKALAVEQPKADPAPERPIN
jgi:hypothetical protein